MKFNPLFPGIDVSAPNNDDQLLIETSNKHFAPIVPPRNLQSQVSLVQCHRIISRN